MQTLWYRAPEVIFGDVGFGPGIDAWSFGVILAEMAGEPFTRGFDAHGGFEPSRATLLDAIVRQLGSPALPEWRQLRGFTDTGARPRAPWPPQLAELLGSAGVAFLDGLLAWCPASRLQTLTETQAKSHIYLHPHSFELGGVVQPMAGQPGKSAEDVDFQGIRHEWNMLTGSMAPEVLSWLRADEALNPGTAAFAALGVAFTGSRSDAKTEERRKFIMAGAMVANIASSSNCALSLAALLPAPRVRAWLRAFRVANGQALSDMQAAATLAVRRLRKDTWGNNGQHFLDSSLEEWFCTAGELCVMRADNEDGSFWEEPRHRDGAASVLHMGVTLYGRRRLRCEQNEGLPDVVLDNAPGTVYLGQLTGPWHQVHHSKASRHELLDVPGLGPCSVTLMLRAALFPHNRARSRNTTPSPVEVFEALVSEFRSALRQKRFRLPSLAECEGALAAEPAEESSGSSKRRRLA